MRFDVFTLFPEVLEPYLQSSILQKAQERELIRIELHNIRDWTDDKHHVTDDLPYGGGGGMVMKPEPIFRAVEAVLGAPPCCPVILFTPQGRRLTQAVVRELAAPALLAKPDFLETTPLLEGETGPEEGFGETDLGLSPWAVVERPSNLPDAAALPPGGVREEELPLIAEPRLGLLCGRYEGVDERVRQHLVTDEISIGDYVLTGGELAALVVIDAVSRLIPGVLGDPEGAWDDSHASGLLEYPHYTRPPEFRGWKVPEVLLSGDHARIERWRREQALLRTWERRPDMLDKAPLTAADRKFLEKLRQTKKG